MAMDSINGTTDVLINFSPYFIIRKDGHIQRFQAPQFAPPLDDPSSAVRTKDVVINAQTGVSVRLYLPNIKDSSPKLPLLVYIHGGAFCLGSAFSPTFHTFVNSLVEKSKVIAVSVDYRLAPESPLPNAFDDSWESFKWVVSHAGGNGPHPWLNEYADFGRVFLGGESAGANIANDLAIRAGVNDQPKGVEIVGLFLVHPFFGGKEEDKLYKYLCPESSGRDDDPRLNPAVDPRLPKMRCKKVLFCLAEKDFLKGRGLAYHEGLKKSEWNGEVELKESHGEGHGFHLFKQDSDKALQLLNWLADFLKQN